MGIEMSGGPAPGMRPPQPSLKPARQKLLRPDRALVTYRHGGRDPQLHKDIAGQWAAAKPGGLKPVHGWAIGFLVIASVVSVLVYAGPASGAAGIGQVLLIISFVILATYGIAHSGDMSSTSGSSESRRRRRSWIS